MSINSNQTLAAPEATLEALEPNINLIPGASILGFGINVARASGPSDVTARIVTIDEAHGTTVTEHGVDYLLPANVSLVDDSITELTYSTFSSRREFSEHMAADAQTDVSGWGFTGEFDAAYSSLTKGESMEAYGLVEANTRLWMLSAQSIQTLALEPSFAKELSELPTEFNTQTQQAFFNLFNKYGTHLVTTSKVGGRLQYSTAVSQSSGFSKETAEANIKLEYDAVFAHASAEGHTDWEKISENWFSSRSAKLLSIGGNTSVLSKAIPPSDPKVPVNYHDLVETWAASVVITPSVIGMHLQPISHVAPVAQAALLDKALSKYLNDGMYGNNTMLVHLWTPPQHITDSSSSILIGSRNVTPPNEPTKEQLSNFWVAMADETGEIKFNLNTLSNDPDEYDKIVKAARVASDGQNWWTVVVMVSVPPRPMSQLVYTWLESCGITLKSRQGYPNWPIHMAAAGKTNTPDFHGRVSFQDSPYYEMQKYRDDWQQHVLAEYPLHITL